MKLKGFSVAGARLLAIGPLAIEGGVSALMSRSELVIFADLSDPEKSNLLTILDREKLRRYEIVEDAYKAGTSSSIDIVISSTSDSEPYIPEVVTDTFEQNDSISKLILVGYSNLAPVLESLDHSPMFKVDQSAEGLPIVLSRKERAKRRRIAIVPGSTAYEDAVISAFSSLSIPKVEEPLDS